MQALPAAGTMLIAEDDPDWINLYNDYGELFDLAFTLVKTPEAAIEVLQGGEVSYFLCDGSGWDEAIQLGISIGCLVVIQTGDPEQHRQYGVPVISKIDGHHAIMRQFLALAGIVV
jgi:hypothetical protein